MTEPRSSSGTPPAQSGGVVISLDAMGGDKGPQVVVAGLEAFLKDTPGSRVLLHGPREVLTPLTRRLGDRVRVVHAPETVAMSDKPSQVMRSGKDTSMWSAIDAVREGEAQAVVSCGNTGALMAVSMLRLRKVPGVNRPAIACLWPSRNPARFNVMLDVGADIRADAEDLLVYALMGTSYARQGLGIQRPRIGLLNVGTEEHKGRQELKDALELIENAAPKGEFDFVGFVEGSDIPSDRVDVIVTDGFTGNVALKTGEGTATLIAGLLREALNLGPLSKLGAVFAMRALDRLRLRIDPRRVNGGVFLGLNGTVIKSHGSADATGVAAALTLAHRLATAGFAGRLAARVATAVALAQDSGTDGGATPAGVEAPQEQQR
ncbi:MAG TPA: phosphate acyltransferase PlsX [Rubellimicrobium sp.]|nr:phosphate acyltransferase PlsX [Rubellimicrobium sp.]